MVVINNGPLKAQLAGLQPGPETGTTFYKYFFTSFPQHKKYFKGHETQAPDTIPGDPYFEKLGTNVLGKLHAIVEASSDEAQFKRMVQEMTISHKEKRGIDAAVWKELPAILGGLLVALGATPAPEWGDFCAEWAKHADEVAANGYKMA